MKEKLSQQQIWKYIDGRTTKAEKVEIDQLLMVNSDLAAEVENYTRLNKALGQLPVKVAPKNLIESAINELRASRHSRVSKKSLWIFLSVMLILVFVAFLLPLGSPSNSLPFLTSVNWIPETSFDWIPHITLSPYLTFLLVIPIFHLIDQVLGKHLVLNKPHF